MIKVGKVLLSFIAINLMVISGCRDEEELLPSCEGTMFGLPIAATGLSDTICKPSCACIDFTSKDFTAAQIEAFRSYINTAPFDTLSSNPYADTLIEKPASVCAVVIDNISDHSYHLENFVTADAAAGAGAYLTHHDACGLCSTMQDFAVYAENRDLGTPVRACGIANFSKPIDSLIVCIEALGFSHPCAQIWAYNTKNTQTMCLTQCLDMGATYHNPDGSLNACLECDEVNSGPVFKYVAGRTRRNTGLASSICRKCDEVEAVAHDYP